MAKNFKKKRKMEPKTCERCGNGEFFGNKMFRCKFCGWLNGDYDFAEYGVVVTEGGIDDR